MGNRCSVLLVEDDLGVREFFVDALENEAECAVTAVETGDQAMAVLRGGARFDLLFTDVLMPGELSGIQLAREARRLDPTLKVLCTTGYPLTDAETRGCDLFLAKPFTVGVLVEAVAKLLACDGKGIPAAPG